MGSPGWVFNVYDCCPKMVYDSLFQLWWKDWILPTVMSSQVWNMRILPGVTSSCQLQLSLGFCRVGVRSWFQESLYINPQMLKPLRMAVVQCIQLDFQIASFPYENETTCGNFMIIWAYEFKTSEYKWLTVYLLKGNTCTNEPMQFKPMVFKGQLYSLGYWKIALGWVHGPTGTFVR